MMTCCVFWCSILCSYQMMLSPKLSCSATASNLSIPNGRLLDYSWRKNKVRGPKINKKENRVLIVVLRPDIPGS